MSYTDPSPLSSGSSNSATQYAAAALGIGLVALGIVMVVWTVVPASSMGNSSQPDHNGGKPNNTMAAAFVMVGIGAAMLLLALCLAIRNKRRSQRPPQQTNVNTDQSQEEQRQSEQEEQYNVPSYEEVVGSEQFPIRQFTSRQDSTTQLPAYEELMEKPQVGSVEPDAASAQPPQTQNESDNSNAAHAHRKNGLPELKMPPFKMRRIKSEKQNRKSSPTSPTQAVVSNVEPLTPPPQYDDMPPELPHPPE